MTSQRIDGAEAWTRLAGAPYSQWPAAAPRFNDGPFLTHHVPAFKLGKEDRLFCMGSCFARNVEEHLIYRGADVLSRRVVSPRAEWGARPNGFLNKFTTQSMLQELRWLEHPPASPQDYLTETGEGWRDLQLAPGLGPSTLERAIERRRYLADDYFPRLRQADVLVLTLGLNEVWFDQKTGIHLNAPPPLWSVRREAGRYRVEITDVEDNFNALEEIRQHMKSVNPDLKIIITVSPVPMRSTFSGNDVIVANSLSKSTLRAAAEKFRLAHGDVDYFPSYEMVTLTPRSLAYAPDQIHVSNRIVGTAMKEFLDLYREDSGSLEIDFVELQYLDANPDVEDRVRSGELSSGFEHWVRWGREEGRPIREEILSERAIQAGQ